MFGGAAEVIDCGHTFGRHVHLGLVAQEQGAGAVVLGAGNEGRALEGEEWRALRQQTVGGKEEARAAHNGSHCGVPQVLTDLAERFFNQEARQAEKHPVGLVQGLGGVGRDGVQRALKTLARGVGAGDAALPGLGMAREHADAHIGMRTQHGGAHMSERAASTNGNVHRAAYVYLPSTSLSAAMRRSLSTWLRMAMRM